MQHQQSNPSLRLAIPKGRMFDGIVQLLEAAGIRVIGSARAYRPTVSLDGCEAKSLKPQNIVEMLHVGSRDVGFTGADWVAELDGEAVELLDTGLDPVRIVAAAPEEVLASGRLQRRPLVIASEYENLTRQWIRERDLDARFVRSYGATEVFPPEDADVIVDNTASGSTLVANGLVVVDELMVSSTRLYANKDALAEPWKRKKIAGLELVLESVLEARRRVMVEVNAPEHLQLSIESPERLSPGLKSFGALFLGDRSAEVLGDYGAGPNHVLPTGGAARYSGGLSVLAFLKMRTWMKTTLRSENGRRLVEDTIWLARQEGLEAHARAAERRLTLDPVSHPRG